MRYKEIEKPKKPKDIEFMNNCMTWINWYYEGETTRIQMLHAAKTLKEYCEKLINTKS